MPENLPLPALAIFGLRYARLILNVQKAHFGLRLGTSPRKSPARLGYHGFPGML